MANQLVSIIIPVFNRANLLEETLASIKKQTYTNWECIIVDDGSTDNSWKIIKKYSVEDDRFKPFSRPNNLKKGANSCRNYGFLVSKGSLINWFDSDDIMHLNFIKFKVAAITKNTDVVISKTCVFKNTIDNIVFYEKRTQPSPNILNDFVSLDVSWYLPDPMWNRLFLEKKVLFDVNLLMGQDRDFHTRRLIENPRAIFINEYLTFYRRHENSITHTNKAPQILSFVASLNKRIELLKFSELSKKAKFALLKLQVCNYRYLYKEKGSFKMFINTFKQLWNWDIGFVLYFFKFIIASITFNLFNRGYYIIK